MAEASRSRPAWLRTRGARAAFWLLALLVASAVYAPWIANDKPYYVRALDTRAVRQSVDTLDVLAGEWRDALGSPGESRAAERALELRLATLERSLEAESAPGRRVEAAREAVEAANDASDRSKRAERSDAAIAILADLAAQLRSLEPPSESASTPWRAAASWPLLESLSFVEWWLAGSLPVLLAAALGAFWRRRAALALACAALAAFACDTAFAPAETLASRSIKAAASNAEAIVERAVFAPIPYGYDETHLSEALRPPTWTDAAEMDARGRYVRGSRAASSSGPAPATEPVEVRFGESSLNCSWRHLLGVDSLGRDVATRLLWGGRVSLSVAFGAVALMLALGVAAGLVAGWLRGAADAVFLFAAQTLQSFPAFFLILVAAALLPTRGVHPQLATALVIGLVSWTGVARLVRAEVLLVRELDFVLASRAAGLSGSRVLWRHVAPNSISPAIVAAAFGLGGAILAESATSFLGFGVQPPVPSWGAVLRESSAVEHWWILVFPGLAVFATVAAANKLGDALRDALDLREERA